MPNLYNPDYLFHLASKYNLNPSKKYGQNYLIDEEILNKILEVAAVTKDETIVEVGPGFGVLTFPLAERAGRVISFEIEKKLQPYWEEHGCHLERSERSLSDSTIMTEISRSARNDERNIEIVWGNVLKQFLNPNFQFPKFKVVANLPYQITSAVIRLFLETAPPPEAMVLMVQKEVAERICAEPGEMSLLSVSVQYYAEPKLEFIVPRESFWPSPRVDSAVISIIPRQHTCHSERSEESLVCGGLRDPSATPQDDIWSDDKNFFSLVKAGFANRRKLLTKNLEPFIGKENKEKLRKIFEELNFLPTIRAQELSVNDWIELFRQLSF